MTISCELEPRPKDAKKFVSGLGVTGSKRYYVALKCIFVSKHKYLIKANVRECYHFYFLISPLPAFFLKSNDRGDWTVPRYRTQWGIQ